MSISLRWEGLSREKIRCHVDSLSSIYHLAVLKRVGKKGALIVINIVLVLEDGMYSVELHSISKGIEDEMPPRCTKLAGFGLLCKLLLTTGRAL